jgi:hypothetical protein
MGTYLKSVHITFNLAKGVICERSQSYIRTIQHGISCGLADANLMLSVKRSVLQLHLVALQYCNTARFHVPVGRYARQHGKQPHDGLDRAPVVSAVLSQAGLGHAYSSVRDGRASNFYQEISFW